jgi:hypothetical protein
LLAALAETGLPVARALDLQIILFSHGQGLAVNLEREARARADTGVDDEQWGDRQAPTFAALAGSGRYPHFARLSAGLADGYDFQLDSLFETSVRALLDGFAVLVDRETRTGVTGTTRTRRPGGAAASAAG